MKRHLEDGELEDGELEYEVQVLGQLPSCSSAGVAPPCHGSC
jgi:hypothetical protein